MSVEDRLNAAWAADTPRVPDVLFRLHVLHAAAQRRARRAAWMRIAGLAASGAALISVSPQLAAWGEPLAILGLTAAGLWALRQFGRVASRI
jgi:hypothetical protein